MWFGKKWNPDGLHCYVTGGSSGLGLSLSLLLVTKGAHVSIVARNKEKLDKALAELEAVRQNPNQILKAYSFSMTSAQESAAALTAACESHGSKAPDAVFTCAGASTPKFFVDLTEEEMLKGMVDGYWIQAWTALAATKLMVKQKRTGKITFVSSTLGYMSFVGWSNYVPGKQALRGLADTLHSELMLYGIDVHIFFPPTMFTAGFDEEQKTKPQIVKDIEEGDTPVTTEYAAMVLYKGVVNGHAHISANFITDLFKASTRGAVPRNNWILDGFLDFIAFIATPIWRASVDRRVLAHREEHQKYLTERGFFNI